jgi:hypothetical protein
MFPLVACNQAINPADSSSAVTGSTTPGHVMTLAPPGTFSPDLSLPTSAGTNPGQDPTKGLQPNAGSSVPQMSMSSRGSLLHNAVLHPIYVGDYWSTPQGQQDRQFNDGFAQAIGNSPIQGVLAEYNVGPSSFGGSSVVAKTFAAGAKFTDSQAQQTVKAELAAGHVSKDAQGIYTVVLPPGVIMDTGGGLSTDGIGGYHNLFSGTGGGTIYYSVICYSDSKGNGIDFNGVGIDAVTITESHEWVEAETDPDIFSGWHDSNTGGELGDVGIWDLDKQISSTVFDMSRCWARQTDGYAYQEEWSMKDKQFEVQSGATPIP